MERLRGLDSTFLSSETSTNHMHVAWAAVLDITDAPDAADRGRLADLIGSRLPRLPALRKRLANPRLGYTQPDWLRVDVDPADHVVLHDAGDIEIVAARILSAPLDRRRPLWELHVVPGVARDRTSIIMKLHHAVLDGPSGAELMVQLLDMEPTPSSGTPSGEPSRAEPEPTSAELRGTARKRAARGAGRAAAGLRRAVDVSAATRRWDIEHADVAGDVPVRAPRTPFNQPVTASRTVRSLGVPLDAIDELRRGTGSTVNDAVLALTGGALRRYLLRRHALPAAPLIAMVPTSLRDAAGATGGNHLSALFTTLGTDIIDPARRLAEVTRVTNIVKRRHDDTGLGSLGELNDLVPPRAAQGIARLAGRLRLTAWGPLAFNVVVSNVPGPDVAFYCNGAIVESAFPMGPVTDWSALNVTVVSYRRQLSFGVVACPHIVPDVDALMDDLRSELVALRDAR